MKQQMQRTDFDKKHFPNCDHFDDFPIEIKEKILSYCRGGVFMGDNETSPFIYGGFIWNATLEKNLFWDRVIVDKDFNLFFERYPKIDIKESDELKELIKLAMNIINSLEKLEDERNNK